MNQAQKRKKKSAALAVVLAVALALTGTFAWQSISQVARNEAKAVVNPGGRLHDDFSGYNYLTEKGHIKKIYVENFTDPDNGGVPIFARVKLTEYMETGEGAGDMKDDGSKAESNKATPLVEGTAIDQPDDWPAYVPDKAGDVFRDYWKLTTGGSQRYMPTFNKNKDSLAADIDGTLAGLDGDVSAGKPYDDYVGYAITSESGDREAYYDADDNDVDEGAGDPTKTGNGGTEGVNYTAVTENHTAKMSGDAKVLTMEEWLAAGAESGAYWVFDDDGWAYWAQAIQPGTATGCLLNSITLFKAMDKDWYYSINATGQFAMAFDWGKPETSEGAGDGTGFYSDGQSVSSNALMLLNAAAGAQYKVTEEGADGRVIDHADRGTTKNLKLYLDEAKEEVNYNGVEWSISDADKANLKAGTNVTPEGVLTVAADEEYERKFTVNAKAKDSNKVIAQSVIVVEQDGVNKLRTIEAGSLETANIDGTDWYVVAKNGTKRLIWSKEMVEMRKFNSTANSNIWESSTVRTYLNDEFLNDKPMLSAVVEPTAINTRSQFVEKNLNEFTETTDKVFLLTEADITGHLARADLTGAVLDEKDYTFNGAALAAEEKPLVNSKMGLCSMFAASEGGNERYYFLRSPYGDLKNIACHINCTSGASAYYTSAYTSKGIRPAMWINLA